MKKIIFASMVLITIFASCKKEIKDVSTVYDANVSKMELIGDPIYAPPAGTTTYVDPGAKFTDDDGSVKTLTTPISLPDLTKPGFYSVQYKATSIHGWIRTATRLVLVTKVDPAVDISGKYARNVTTLVTITKLGPGLYKTNNVGGVPNNPAYIFDVYFGQLNDSTLAVPSQPNPLGGNIACENATVKKNGAKYVISWNIVENTTGFSTVPRIFVQQ